MHSYIFQIRSMCSLRKKQVSRPDRWTLILTSTPTCLWSVHWLHFLFYFNLWKSGAQGSSAAGRWLGGRSHCIGHGGRHWRSDSHGCGQGWENGSGLRRWRRSWWSQKGGNGLWMMLSRSGQLLLLTSMTWKSLHSCHDWGRHSNMNIRFVLHSNYRKIRTTLNIKICLHKTSFWQWDQIHAKT